MAACEMGCLVGGASTSKTAAARAYGQNLGLCFQIVDDILDSTSTAQQLGKPAGSDVENEKVTYVSLLGLEDARRLAERRTREAVEYLEPFGAEAEHLRRLARALLERKK